MTRNVTANFFITATTTAFLAAAVSTFALTGCDPVDPGTSTGGAESGGVVRVDMTPCCVDNQCDDFQSCGVSGFCTPACSEEPGNVCGNYLMDGQPVHCRTDPMSPPGTAGECVLACSGLVCPGDSSCGTIVGPAGTKAQACVSDILCPEDPGWSTGDSGVDEGSST